MIYKLFKNLRKLKKPHGGLHSGKNSEQEMQSFFIDITKTVVESCNGPCAEKLIKMLYKVADKHGVMNEETLKAIVEIIPSRQPREKISTTVEILNVNQVNINPNQVINLEK